MDLYLIIIIVVTVIFVHLLQRFFRYYFKINNNEEANNRDDTKEIKEAGGLIQYIKEQHKNHGDLIEFYIGNNCFVSIIDPYLIKAALKLAYRPKPLYEFLEPLVGKDNLTVYDGERAANLRKLVANSIHSQVFSQKYDLLLNVANEIIIDDWNKKCKNNETLFLQESLLKFGLISTVNLLVGLDSPDLQMNEFKQAYDGAMGALFDKQQGLCDEETAKSIDKNIKFIRSYFKNLLEKRRTLLKTVPNRSYLYEVADFCEILLTENDPNTGKPFTEEDKMSHLSLFLLAGYHTTAVSICWTLFALLQNPEVYNKVQKEIDDNIPTEPSIKDLEKLKYLNQVFKEGMRMYPPGLFAARLVEDNLHFPNGFTIKNGSTLFVPIPLLHKNSKYWENPDCFDPNRFDDTKNDVVPYSYCPFGFGPRICPGEKLAKQEARLILALILKNFDLALDMKPEEVLFSERFVLMAKDDIKIRVKSRKQ